jgi:hypothetical protein
MPVPCSRQLMPGLRSCRRHWATERLRFPACTTAPGGPETTTGDVPAARPTRRQSCPPLLRGCRRDRGIFGGRPLSRARGRQKWSLSYRSSPRNRGVSRIEMPTQALLELRPLCLAIGAARKGRLSSGRPLGSEAVLSSPKLESDIPPVVRTTARGLGCAPPANATALPPG